MSLRPLPAGTPGVESLTFPRYRPLLARLGDGASPDAPFAVAAFRDERPIGLALFSRCIARAGAPGGVLDHRVLLSVVVEHLERRAGLGTRLLEAGEDLAARGGAHVLSAVHSSRTPGRAAFEALLAKRRWTPPRELDMRVCGRAAWAARARADWAPFLTRCERKGYTSSTWETMGDEDRSELARLASEMPAESRHFDPRVLPEWVVPVPALSLFLRREGRIAGWVVGARGALPDSIHYTHGYVVPEVQRPGWLIAGMRDVCERQASLMGPESFTLYEADASNAGMRRLIERHIGPYAEWVDTRYSSEKVLSAGS